jgi:hypothetical protein
MSDLTGSHRAARRNLSTQPVQGRAAAAKVKHPPISPDELAFIIDRAREQRTEESITAYSRKKEA